MSTEHYDVTVANAFEASSPQDAAEQMIHWLQENAGSAGFRVQLIRRPSETWFIDADGSEFRDYLSDPERMD
jgi:hypothetical protein